MEQALGTLSTQIGQWEGKIFYGLLYNLQQSRNALWAIIPDCAHVTQTGFDNGAKLLLCMFLWQLKLPFHRWHNVACWFYTMKVTYASRPISVHTQ